MEFNDYEFKDATLACFGKEVIVTLKKDSALSNVYGSMVKGKLIGRVWGEKLVDGKSKSTVIAMNVETLNGEIQMSRFDVAYMEEYQSPLTKITPAFSSL